MVCIGSGGAFNGITYADEQGEIRTAEDYILNRLPLARAFQYVQIFWAMQRVACVKPAGQNAAASIIV